MNVKNQKDHEVLIVLGGDIPDFSLPLDEALKLGRKLTNEAVQGLLLSRELLNKDSFSEPVQTPYTDEHWLLKGVGGDRSPRALLDLNHLNALTHNLIEGREVRVKKSIEVFFGNNDLFRDETGLTRLDWGAKCWIDGTGKMLFSTENEVGADSIDFSQRLTNITGLWVDGFVIDIDLLISVGNIRQHYTVVLEPRSK